MVTSNSVRFWLYLVPLVPSIIITIFDLYYLRLNRTLRKTIRNDGIRFLLICVLIGELFDIIWSIHYYRTNSVLSATSQFCLIWAFISSTTSVSIHILIGWISIERYIVTFHLNYFSTKVKRFFFHYLFLILCILCPITFYSVMFFILSCDVPFNYNSSLCDRYQCIFNHHSIALWDSIVHYIMPVCITVVSTGALFVRVVYHTSHIRKAMDWHQHGKLAVQILPISTFYILLQLPPIILYTSYLVGQSEIITNDYYSDSLYFRHWIILFTPFVYFLTLPELRTRPRKIIIYWQNRRSIQPITIDLPAQHIHHTFAMRNIVQQ